MTDITKPQYPEDLRAYFRSLGGTAHTVIRDRFVAEIAADHPDAAPEERLKLLGERLEAFYRTKARKAGDTMRARNAARRAAAKRAATA